MQICMALANNLCRGYLWFLYSQVIEEHYNQYIGICLLYLCVYLFNVTDKAIALFFTSCNTISQILKKQFVYHTTSLYQSISNSQLDVQDVSTTCYGQIDRNNCSLHEMKYITLGFILAVYLLVIFEQENNNDIFSYQQVQYKCGHFISFLVSNLLLDIPTTLLKHLLLNKVTRFSE